MSTWHDEIQTTGGVVDLPPDPRVLDSLGRNHNLETALADLVDNSIDACASHVLIRFVRREGRLRALYVVDNGHGMSPHLIDEAMTMGAQRKYDATSLGRFGLGLKAASLSQASSLTVVSQARGLPPVGRRWQLGGDRNSFACDVVSPDFAVDELNRSWEIPWAGSGTVVRWDSVNGFPATDDPQRVESFISRTTTAIINHLALIFHRLLANNQVQLSIDVEDVEQAELGPRFDVKPLNPFGYLRSGKATYPKDLTARWGDAELRFRCHVWPGRSSLPEFRLQGGQIERQGLYFYRRDRLLQAGGGWDGIHATDQRLQLARVEIDIEDDISGLFRMNPEKSRVLVGPDFSRLAEDAQAQDGTTFAEYLSAAEEKYRESRQRDRGRKSMLPPGRGFPRSVRRAIEQEVPLMSSEGGLDIRWRRFADGNFFAADLETRTLWLNDAYRPDSIAERRGLNDAPMLKTLLYLLFEDVFHGEYLGARDKDNIALWQELLTTAATTESE